MLRYHLNLDLRRLRSRAILIRPEANVAHPLRRSVDAQLVPIHIPEGALPGRHPLSHLRFNSLVPLGLLPRYRPITLFRLECECGKIIVGRDISQQIKDGRVRKRRAIRCWRVLRLRG